MATKIRLKRMGKKFYAFYRVVIMDSRTKRDGRAIEEIGTYNPNTQPSTININSERAQYWLGVGAQPTEQVLNLLKITGDWQKFKGLDGAEGTLKTVEAGPDAAARVEAVEAQAQKLKAAKSEADAKAKPPPPRKLRLKSRLRKPSDHARPGCGTSDQEHRRFSR